MKEIDLYWGNSYNLTATIKDTSGNIVNISGKTVIFTVKRFKDLNDKDDTEKVIQKIITNHSDPANGKTVISLTSDDMKIAEGFYYADIKIPELSRNSVELYKINVKPVVTRT